MYTNHANLCTLAQNILTTIMYTSLILPLYHQTTILYLKPVIKEMVHIKSTMVLQLIRETEHNEKILIASIRLFFILELF